MMRFMVSLVVRWVILPSLVVHFVLARFWVTSNQISLQASILFSSCITATLTACSPFGQQSTLEYGFQGAQPKPDPSLSLQPPPLILILVCWLPSYFTSGYSQTFQLSRLSGTRSQGTGLRLGLRRPLTCTILILNSTVSTWEMQMLFKLRSGITSSSSMAGDN